MAGLAIPIESWPGAIAPGYHHAMMRPSGSVVAKLRLRQLALIVHTAETGSLHEAADRSNVSQPAGTKMLREAELLFGARIFERTSRGMRTTALGEVVVAYARGVVTDLARLRKDVEAIAGGATGTVSLGSISAAGPLVLARAIAELAKAQPRIAVAVRVDTSDVMIPMLLDGKLDFVIGRSYGNSARELEFERLSKRVHLSVVVGVKHPLRKLSKVSPAALQDLPWILHPAGNLLRHAIEQAFRDADLQPPAPTVETTSDTFTVSLLQQTSMAAVMSSETAGLYERTGLLRILPTTLRIKLEPYGLLTRPGREMLPAPKTLLALLRKLASEADA
jgi:DNA-binding transcriptional LysR family regulator